MGIAATARRTLDAAAWAAVALLTFAWPLLTGLDASGRFDYVTYRVAALAALSPAMLAYVLSQGRRVLREPWLLASLAALAWGLLLVLVLVPTGDTAATWLGYAWPQTADGVVPWCGTWLAMASAWLLLTDPDGSGNRRATLAGMAVLGGALAALLVGFEFARTVSLSGIVRSLTARPSGTAPNAVAYAAMAVTLLGIAYVALRRLPAASPWRAVAAVGTGVLAASVVLSASRGGTLSLLPLSGWAIAADWRAGRRRRALVLVALTLAVLGLVFGVRSVGTSVDLDSARTPAAASGSTAFSGREWLWASSLDLVAERPLGWGLTWQRTAYDGEASASSGRLAGIGFLRAHNGPLDTLLVWGVPGTLLMALALVLLAARIDRGRRQLATVPAAMLAVAWLTYHSGLYASVPAVLLAALAAWPVASDTP